MPGPKRRIEPPGAPDAWKGLTGLNQIPLKCDLKHPAMNLKTAHSKIYPGNFLLRLLLPLLFLAAGNSLSARHIIGGNMTYECLGNNTYRFTLQMYRDCFCSDCADFDPVAHIAVYRCGSQINCGSLGQFSAFREIDVPLSGPPINVERPDYPCLIPPSVCVEQGMYTWQMTLPQSSESYHVSYQRCCRNITISNIVAPQNSGATFTIEITPLAQQLCNNSPVFNSFPPTVICANQPLSYDHSATDPDGDLLVYEFCSPLLGGGPLLDGNSFESCDGAAPNPACGPPYDFVSFKAPNYTPAFPMGGDPPVTINPFTGEISGTPTTLGQFVVGVCVSEYRDGELLSRVFRDFQFNVANCDPTVVADVKEDRIINDQEFLIQSCGEYTISFLNESYQQNFIKSHRWEFNINNSIQTFNEWSPTVTFPGVGEYRGRLMVNPGQDCGDTAFIYVNIFPEIEAGFTYEYDTCVAGPVRFTDTSTTGSCCLTNWDWDFGDNGQSGRQNPSHLYRQPGNIPVTLTVRDTNQCEDEITEVIPYFPVPSLIIISPSTYNGCAPADIFFDNLSFPIDDTYDILWDFGDGGTETEISPSHIYTNPGTYSIGVEITSPIGCMTDTFFKNLITILPAPEAGFSYTPSDPSNLNPKVFFSDESSGANGWIWDFGTGVRSSLANPVYTFPDTGLFEVRQIVVHPSGCRDTLVRLIDVKPEVRFHLPNAFTPNNDGTNDTYLGVGIIPGLRNFNMTIWNRWGEMIFETSDPNEGWNGLKNNKGKEAPNGVYLVMVTYTAPRGQVYYLKSYATLVR